MSPTPSDREPKPGIISNASFCERAIESFSTITYSFFFHDSEPAPVRKISITKALMKTVKNLRVLKNITIYYTTKVEQPPHIAVAANTIHGNYKIENRKINPNPREKPFKDSVMHENRV